MAILVLFGIILLLVGFFKPKGAGILVQTTPAASVFVDGEQVGRTPYNAVHNPEEVVIKLVPESFDTPLTPYETVVNLTSGVETVVVREFGESEEDSAGEIVSFEKVGKGETSLAVLSDPDSAQIKIDGIIRGFAPFKTTDIVSGEYTLTLSAPGYKERSIKIQTREGYMLTVVVKLVSSGEVVEEEIVEGEEDEEKVVYVKILSTPTNFLRVRSEPTTTGNELTKVTPGERFVFVEENEEGDWYKIEYKEAEGDLLAQTGWIFSTYAEMTEDGEIDGAKDITPAPTEDEE